jgi:hypothetical protein
MNSNGPMYSGSARPPIEVVWNASPAWERPLARPSRLAANQAAASEKVRTLPPGESRWLVRGIGILVVLTAALDFIVMDGATVVPEWRAPCGAAT